MSVFEKRARLKPYEYPEVIKFSEGIQHSYWLVSEWNFISDIQDFKIKLTDKQRNIAKNAMLAISQIEVAVKKFWTKIGDRFPKAEFESVGVVFGESEVRHQEAYSKLLEVLGLNLDFELLLENPAIKGRVDYLQKYLKNANSDENEEYSLTLTLFSLFVENVSLFSQFLILKSFNKYLKCLKDIDNVIDSTMHEENLHALFGAYLINLIKKEKPQWFNEAFYEKLTKACKKAYLAEEKIIDWIFEQGELSFLSKDVVKEFIKDRFNQSLKMIDAKEVFEIDKDKLKQVKWFNEEKHAQISVDFFHKKSNAYTKRTKSIKAEDLF